MANTIEDFQNKTSAFLALVSQQLVGINESVASTAKGFIQERVQADGIKGNGQKLGTYSTTEIPFFFKKGGKTLAPYSSGALGSGAESKLAASKKAGKKTLSYKEWREFNGLESSFVNLTFTGSMWNDIGVLNSVVQGNTVITFVGAKDTATRKGGQKTSEIMQYNADKFGDFMTVTAEEEYELAKIYDMELQKLIDKTFND